MTNWSLVFCICLRTKHTNEWGSWNDFVNNCQHFSLTSNNDIRFSITVLLQRTLMITCVQLCFKTALASRQCPVQISEIFILQFPRILLYKTSLYCSHISLKGLMILLLYSCKKHSLPSNNVLSPSLLSGKEFFLSTALKASLIYQGG